MKKNLLLIQLFMPALLFANPTYDATQGALQNNSALCGYGYNPNCSSENTGRQIVKHIIIDLPSKYGAIVQSTKTGAFTSSLNKDSEREAERTAIEYCESMKGNGKCRIIYTIANGCHALATGRISSKLHRAFYAAGKNSERGQSESAALNKCQKSGALDCRILMPEECSLPEIPN